jgi:hypothetical protein
MREAEQSRRRVPHRLARHFSIWIRSIATGIQRFLTKIALTARDRERHYDAVTSSQIPHSRTHFNDLTHGLMAQNVAALHRRHKTIEEVEI